MTSASSVALPGGVFHYLERGPKGAPLVLLLHGFPDQPRGFDATIRRINASGSLRCVAPWMRGYAPSVRSGPYDAARLAHDLIDVADALSPGVPVRVVGHDWGAVAVYAALMLAPARFAAAVTMAVPHPGAFLRNLARFPAQLARSWYMAFFQLPWIAERAVGARDFALIRRLWRAWSPGYTPPPAYLDELEACLRASMPAPIAYYRALRRPPMRIRRISVPTLHLHGADDGCIAPELGRGQERWFTGPFASRVIPGAGHFLHLEQPEVVGDAIAAWFDEVAPAR